MKRIGAKAEGEILISRDKSIIVEKDYSRSWAHKHVGRAEREREFR